MKSVFNIQSIVRGGVVAALYAALTLAFAPISYGLMQVRVSEAMTVLPFFFPEAVPGLFIGCLIANLLGGAGIYDVIFGPLATLVAALFTLKIKKLWLAPLPPVIFNALIIGAVLTKLLIGTPDQTTYFTAALLIAAGQTIACYGLGLPLAMIIKRLGRGLKDAKGKKGGNSRGGAGDKGSADHEGYSQGDAADS